MVTPPNTIRIIGGQWKRSKLAVAKVEGLRPTPDRVRETLFNWLGQDVTGWRCIDAFAGTGALGFEAASRGAAQVLLLEAHPQAASALKNHIQRLQAQAVIRLIQGDALSALKRLSISAPHAHHLLFLDPPYAETALYEACLGLAAHLLAPHGLVYLEAQRPFTQAELSPYGLELYRHLKAGQVHAHLLRLSV